MPVAVPLAVLVAVPVAMPLAMLVAVPLAMLAAVLVCCELLACCRCRLLALGLCSPFPVFPRAAPAACRCVLQGKGRQEVTDIIWKTPLLSFCPGLLLLPPSTATGVPWEGPGYSSVPLLRAVPGASCCLLRPAHSPGTHLLVAETHGGVTWVTPPCFVHRRSLYVPRNGPSQIWGAWGAEAEPRQQPRRVKTAGMRTSVSPSQNLP